MAKKAICETFLPRMIPVIRYFILSRLMRMYNSCNNGRKISANNGCHTVIKERNVRKTVIQTGEVPEGSNLWERECVTGSSKKD